MELMGRMPDKTVSMILTDPPYGIAYQNKFTTRKYPVLEGDKGMDYRRFAAESYPYTERRCPCLFLYPV